MTLVLCENDFNKQIDAFPCHFTNIPIEDVLIVETINKPLTFAETHLLQRTIKQWCTFTANKKLLRLCFTKWKIHQKNIKSNTTESTTKKIDNLISELHKQKLKKRQKSNLVPSDKPPEKRRRSFTECFENRFKTQKDIIEMQKNKLEQQTRIIEDLKLGIIRDELSQSLETTKTKLSEIFGKCSQKMKCKTAPTGVAFEDTLATLVMNSNKTPKFVQQMERRALERAKNREIIRERKRLIDEEKKRLFEAAVEQKRMQDEEEKRRNLEAVKEKQRAELERQKLMQINKERYLANLKKADSFYRMKIVWRCFGRLQHNVYISENNMLKAEAFQERKLKKNVFVNWTSFIQEKYREQNEKADETFRNNILSRSMQLWKNHHMNCVQNLQVARDYYDVKLLSNTFIHWHRFVCRQFILEQRNLKRATKHYNSHILVQYFYQWKSLPAIVQLEKAKEEKKRKWREKVKEIIPDYSPPDFDI